MTARLYGIGVGPGDPELVTMKAARLLSRLPVVALPESAAGRERLAYNAAAPYLAPGAEVLTLDFPMATDRALRLAARARAGVQVLERLRGGHDVGFISIGDPAHYSTFAYVRDAVIAEGHPVEMVPGITSYSAAAARTGTILVREDERLAVVPVTPGMDAAALMDGFDCVVFMKASVRGGGLGPALAAARAAGGWDIVIVSRCGLPGEVVTGDPAYLEGEVPYLTTVIARKTKEGVHD